MNVNLPAVALVVVVVVVVVAAALAAAAAVLVAAVAVAILVAAVAIIVVAVVVYIQLNESATMMQPPLTSSPLAPPSRSNAIHTNINPIATNTPSRRTKHYHVSHTTMTTATTESERTSIARSAIQGNT